MTKQLSIEELWEYLPKEYKFVAAEVSAYLDAIRNANKK